MFGKDFNKTLERKGDSWEEFIQLVKEIHEANIRGWSESPNKNMKKAYKKIFD
jgi:hypothetical protein